MSSTSTFPNKPYSDPMDCITPEDWIRHPELYFGDGTIVLVVQTVVFRVYHGLLSSRSEVFQDMITVGSGPATTIETYDGCPVVVQLQGDSAEEFSYFLNALLGGYTFYGPSAGLTIHAVGGILRLSHKYMVPSLRQPAVKYFEDRIPVSLEEYDQKTPPRKMFSSPDWWIPRDVLAKTDGSTLNLVTLFRECGLDKFLPWIFYEMTFRLLPGEIIAIESLPNEIKAQLFQGKGRFEREYRRRYRKVFELGEEEAVHMQCNERTRYHWLNWMGDTYDNRAALCILDSPPLIKSEDGTVELVQPAELDRWQPCYACGNTWISESLQVRRELWDRLPGYFGLDNWDVLKSKD